MHEDRVSRLKEIPQIIFQEDEIAGKKDILPLKELFQKHNMDDYQVDCLVLRKIAEQVLQVETELRIRKIYAGLYDLEDIYVNMKSSGYPVYFLRPERFQQEDQEQDYEWYPEDERMFGETEWFDEKSQPLADQRLLYKIMIGSSKGNVKTPPMNTGSDYSSLFYGTLPVEWKEHFEKGEVWTLERWQKELRDVIEEEETYEKHVADSAPSCKEKDRWKPEEVQNHHRKKYCIHVILRRMVSDSSQMSRILYEKQEELEIEKKMGRYDLQQAFVYGDGMVRLREFQEYPEGFHVQLAQKIQEYSIVETLLVACDWMLSFMKGKKEDHLYGMYLLCDGRVENNAMFHHCLKRLELLRDKGVEIQLITGKDSACEGWEQVRRLTDVS